MAIAIHRRNVDREMNQTVLSSAPPDFARHLQQLTMPGAPYWLTELPRAEHGYHLLKDDCRDALALRYGWAMQDVPARCACGQAFSVARAMCCAKGGFPTIRHDEVRDVLADLLTEVCPDIAIEPFLTPIMNEVFVATPTNTNSDARADIRARGFWTRAQNAFFE